MVIIGFLVCQLLVNASHHRQNTHTLLIFMEIFNAMRSVSKISSFAKCSDRPL
ncbi:hypothetical protein X946_5139 [Burkholderia sp. ABCPW 111]|nr:hypothetical protein X946_5139 [Burkholderia sp. ABCPW 111]